MYRFWPLFLMTLCASVSLMATSKRFVVVIDAGHGGRDMGAVRGSAREKEINLNVALKLGRYIEQTMSDVKVIYTRKKDVFVALDRRAEIANKAKANLFISIHTNSTASKTTTASGAETYILGLDSKNENMEVAKRENSVILLEDNYSRKYEGFNPRSPESYIIFEFMTNVYMEQSLEMANYVQREFKQNTRQKDKGVRQAGFLVLRRTSMPSILVEVGFINNERDAGYITSDSGQSALAQSIYKAFSKYKRSFDKKQGRISTPIKVVDEYSDKKDEEKDKVDNARSPKQNKKSKKEKSSKVIGKNNDNQEEKDSKTEASVLNKGIEYRVQFFMSKEKIKSGSPKFKGLGSVTFYKEKDLYKYTYGSAKTMAEAVKLQNEARKKFPDAFVVKFQNGEKIN